MMAHYYRKQQEEQVPAPPSPLRCVCLRGLPGVYACLTRQYAPVRCMQGRSGRVRAPPFALVVLHR